MYLVISSILYHIGNNMNPIRCTSKHVFWYRGRCTRILILECDRYSLRDRVFNIIMRSDTKRQLGRQFVERNWFVVICARNHLKFHSYHAYEYEYQHENNSRNSFVSREFKQKTCYLSYQRTNVILLFNIEYLIK